jgi:hypothetical protein
MISMHLINCTTKRPVLEWSICRYYCAVQPPHIRTCTYRYAHAYVLLAIRLEYAQDVF